MRKDRLLKLSEFLATKTFSESERFSLVDWYNKDECGTVGCAIGWATTLFNNEGFTLSHGGNPMYEHYFDWAAVCKFFNINSCCAEYLFLRKEYSRENINNPLAVAARIREFVKEKEAEK